MNTVSRRDFLTRSSTAIALASGAGVYAAARGGAPAELQAATKVPAEPHRDFPTDPRARLAVASYPFRDVMDSPFYRRRNPGKTGMDLPAFAAMVVERFNIRNIEPWSPHIQARTPADLETLRAGIEKPGVRVIDIAADVRQSVYDPDPDRRRAAVDAGKQWVDIAAAIGSPSIRLHVAEAHGAQPITRTS